MKSINKYLVLFTMFFICTLSSFAQTEHMKFMGIPITGSMIDIEKKLEEKGFVYKIEFSEGDTTNIIREYEGIFTGSKVSVYVVSDYDIVWKIEVKYPDYNSFSAIEKDYKTMVKQYSIKYGDKIEHYEFFNDSTKLLDDYDKLQQLKEGQCHYISFWDLENGNISIRIASDLSLRISYADAESLNKKEAYSRIQDDI